MSITTEGQHRTGRNFIRKGDPCRIKGQRGMFMFVGLSTGTTGKRWADVVGPLDNPRTRAFDPEKVTRVRGTIERSPFGVLVHHKPVKGAKA